MTRLTRGAIRAKAMRTPVKVHLTEHYERRRIAAPSACQPGSFRTHDIGRPGGSKRVACVNKRTGKWMTQSLLIGRYEPPSMKVKLRGQAKVLRERYVRQANAA